MPTASFICWANHLLILISNLPIYQGKILTKYAYSVNDKKTRTVISSFDVYY